MPNEKTTEDTKGGTKRGPVIKDGTIVKVTVGTILAGTATAIAIAAKPAKVIFKIGKFAITKKP